MGHVDDAFGLLKSNLEITDTERTQAITRHHLVRDHVRSLWTLDDDFLTGSYDRHTKTKRLKDVDIFVVIDPDGPEAHLAAGSGRAAVEALRKVMAERWDEAVGDDWVVTISYAGDEVASYEVCPVFVRDGGGYLMPDGTGWMATDPTIHASLVSTKNKECDGKFVPFVKMVKGINREFDEPIHPSFLIEVMALDLVRSPFGRYQDEIRWFLATAADRIAEDWHDPAGLGPVVNRGVSSSMRKSLASTLESWLAQAEEAVALEDADRDRTAVDAWRSLFGWRMPRP